MKYQEYRDICRRREKFFDTANLLFDSLSSEENKERLNLLEDLFSQEITLPEPEPEPEPEPNYTKEDFDWLYSGGNIEYEEEREECSKDEQIKNLKAICILEYFISLILVIFLL